MRLGTYIKPLSPKYHLNECHAMRVKIDEFIRFSDEGEPRLIFDFGYL